MAHTQTQTKAGVARENPETHNLWEIASTEAGEKSKRAESSVYIVGHRSSGKTSVKNLLLQKTTTIVPEATDVLEYTFMRKRSSSHTQSNQAIANVYEVGGSAQLSYALSCKDSVFLPPKSLSSATVLICVDGSRPAEAIAVAEHWLSTIESKISAVLDRLERKGSKLPSQLRERMRRFFGASHADVGSVKHLGVPVVLALCKQDSFQDFEGEQRKCATRALRHIAHKHGAALFAVGGLASGAHKHFGQDVHNAFAPEQKALRMYLTHLAFTGVGSKPTFSIPSQASHDAPLALPIGSDSFHSIGGDYAGDPAASDALEQWKRSVQSVLGQIRSEFPNHGTQPSDNVIEVSSTERPAEPAIDREVEQQMREVQTFVARQEQRQKRSAKTTSARSNGTEHEPSAVSAVQGQKAAL